MAEGSQPQLLTLSPPELRFKQDARRQLPQATLVLHNPGAETVAFKVRTTAPRCGSARPPPPAPTLCPRAQRASSLARERARGQAGGRKGGKREKADRKENPSDLSHFSVGNLPAEKLGGHALPIHTVDADRNSPPPPKARV